MIWVLQRLHQKGLVANLNRLKDGFIFTLCLAAFILAIGLVFFVTASFTATHSVLIRWGDGWRELKDIFGA